MNLQIVLKLKRKLFFKNSLKIGSQNYLFRCYLIFVLTCNFFSRWQFLLLHTEKTHDTKCNNRFCPPISRHNRKSFWTPVNSERFLVSNIFNESSDCFQVQRLQITISWKTKVVLLFHCESSHACQPLAPLVETKTNKYKLF